ncbi:MAG: alpha/beta hydrolase, partial [Acidimicrobiaceae bacterium]
MGFALLAAACGGNGVDNVDSFEKTLSWGDCKGKDAPEDPFQCATLTVPANYRDAGGDTLKIALVRLPASEGKAKGIILTNPGGPGQSGVQFMQYNARDLASSLGLQQFDIVGFDPRGVDRSGGVRCLTDKQLDMFLYADNTPDTPEEKKVD